MLSAAVIGLSGCFTYISSPIKQQSDKYETIIKRLEDTIKRQPNSKQTLKARFELGKIYINLGYLKRALLIYRSILSKHPNSLAAQFQIVYVYFLQGRVREAVNILLMLEKHPNHKNNPKLLLTIAVYYEFSRDYKTAILKYTAVKNSQRATAKDRAYAQFMIAKLYCKLSKHVKALQAFLQLNDDYYKFEALYFMGEIYFSRARYQKALTAYKSFIEKSQDLRSYYTFRALYKIAVILRSPQKAVRIYKQLAKARPEAGYLISYFMDIYNNVNKRSIVYSYKNKGMSIISLKFDKKIYTLISTRAGGLTNIIPGPVKVIGKDLIARYPNGVKIIFRNFAKTLWKNFYVFKCFHDLPGFFKGLKIIEIKNETSKRAGAHYSLLFRKITMLQGSDLEALAHELFHHWDISLTGSPWNISIILGQQYDPSEAFYKISWQKRCYPFVCVIKRKENDRNDFVGNGRRRPLEDIAYFGGIYYAHGKSLRNFVRKEMAKGNFEPAAKYLYIKNMTPVGGREWGVSKGSPYLTAEEVNRKLEKWLIIHPGGVRKYTVKLIKYFRTSLTELISRLPRYRY